MLCLDLTLFLGEPAASTVTARCSTAWSLESVLSACETQFLPYNKNRYNLPGSSIAHKIKVALF